MSPLEFYGETVQKVRKQYECECCKKIIEVGEAYARRSALGELKNRKLCLKCNEAVTAFCSETDNDFTYNDIQIIANGVRAMVRAL